MEDAESLVDTLFEAGILREDHEGVVRTTREFESTRAIYHDTYGHASDEDVYESFADAFDLDVDEAERQIETGDVSRQAFITYLSIRSHLENPGAFSRQEIGVMADVVTELTPGSPVPVDLLEVTDGSYQSFLAEHPNSVVVVVTHHCDPCESLKDALDELRGAVPEHVTWAGVDGEEATTFGETHGVEAAPTTLCFRDGDLVESKRGWSSAAQMADALASVYKE